MRGLLERLLRFLFFFEDTANTGIYTLSLHDALPICPVKAAELFAFTLRVRAGNTDVLTDAEENVRQKERQCFLRVHARSEERFSRNAETDLVCRLLLEKKNGDPVAAIEGHRSAFSVQLQD